MRCNYENPAYRVQAITRSSPTVLIDSESDHNPLADYARAMPDLHRRTFAAGAGVTVLTALALSGCSSESNSPADDPDALAVATAVEALQSAHRQATELGRTGLATAHAGHLEALGAAPMGATAPTTQTPSTGTTETAPSAPSSQPPPSSRPATPPAILPALRRTERDLQALLTDSAGTVPSGSLARTLASIAASVATYRMELR